MFKTPNIGRTVQMKSGKLNEFPVQPSEVSDDGPSHGRDRATRLSSFTHNDQQQCGEVDLGVAGDTFDQVKHDDLAPDSLIHDSIAQEESPYL